MILKSKQLDHVEWISPWCWSQFEKVEPLYQTLFECQSAKYQASAVPRLYVSSISIGLRIWEGVVIQWLNSLFLGGKSTVDPWGLQVQVYIYIYTFFLYLNTTITTMAIHNILVFHIVSKLLYVLQLSWIFLWSIKQLHSGLLHTPQWPQRNDWNRLNRNSSRLFEAPLSAEAGGVSVFWRPERVTYLRSTGMILYLAVAVSNFTRYDENHWQYHYTGLISRPMIWWVLMM